MSCEDCGNLGYVCKNLLLHVLLEYMIHGDSCLAVDEFFFCFLIMKGVNSKTLLVILLTLTVAFLQCR